MNCLKENSVISFQTSSFDERCRFFLQLSSLLLGVQPGLGDRCGWCMGGGSRWVYGLNCAPVMRPLAVTIWMAKALPDL